MESRIINDKIELIKRDDQIYIYKAINKCSIDVETVKMMTEAGDEWNGTELCANLIDIRDMLFADSEARSYGAKQYRDHVAGQAFLVDSRISSSFANLFLRFSKPKLPTRLFTKEEEAIEWLKDQMKNHKMVK
jgi:hypothetical protein